MAISFQILFLYHIFELFNYYTHNFDPKCSQQIPLEIKLTSGNFSVLMTPKYSRTSKISGNNLTFSGITSAKYPLAYKFNFQNTY